MWKELWYLIKLLFSNITTLKAEIVEMKHFPFKGYLAMSWCGKVITRNPLKITDKVLNHERIHLELANLLGKTWIKFYWEYIKEWIKGNPLIAPASSAYYTIPFEMEAYGNEHDFYYRVTKDSLKKYKIKDRKETYKNTEIIGENFVEILYKKWRPSNQAKSPFLFNNNIVHIILLCNLS